MSTRSRSDSAPASPVAREGDVCPVAAPLVEAEAAPMAPRAPSSNPNGCDSVKSGGQAAPGMGTNVLADSMKFGKLLNRVRNDGRVYLNYKELKQCLGDHRLFVEKLKREIRYIDTYYTGEEKALLQKGNATTTDVLGLLRFVVLNVLAALKLMVKKDRWLGGASTCRPDVLPCLEQSAVYNSLSTSALFVNPPEKAKAGPALPCVGCGAATFFPVQLHSCAHTFCWMCLFSRHDKAVQICPVCTEPLAVGSGTILCEEVLGVEQKVLPRRERRRKDKKGDKEGEDRGADPDGKKKDSEAGNILTESDDEKAHQRFQYYCGDCSMVLNSFRQAQIHSNGQRHLDQVQRLKDRAQREGAEYESAGVVEYSNAVKVEGVPKPRRSRGGAKNRLKQQRFEDQQQLLATQQQQLEQMQRRLLSQQQAYENRMSISSLFSNTPIYPGGEANAAGAGPYAAGPELSRELSASGQLSGSGQLGGSGYQNMTGGGGMIPHHRGPASSRSSHSPYATGPDQEPHSPASQGGVGPRLSAYQRVSSGYAGDHGLPRVSSMSSGMHQYSYQQPGQGRAPSEYEPSVSDTTGVPSLCASSMLMADKTHAFQSERMNTVLRQAIEQAIQRKEVDKSLKSVKKVMVEPKGCEVLVDEIFRGVFNGENTIEYAALCRKLIDSPEPEVSLSIHEFCHLLLQRCRQSVTTPVVTMPTTYDMPQEQIDALEETELRSRFRRVTSIKFSADLYSQGILPEALVHLCIQAILYGQPGQPSEDKEVTTIDEDALASVCRIFTTVGDKLRDNSAVAVSNYCISLERSLGQISSSRVRRKVQNIIDKYKLSPKDREALSAGPPAPVQPTQPTTHSTEVSVKG
eukprot:TRINITY_DN2230_c0_g5_i1.p1 TRINITY_DN2230_c0_g5~~TRINITY_DN2230_c0_g5_i1.p1  ORF type:complete len:858 (+),score=282.21 TRINITY_DN2230_c0_g5_i1:66-2639(+)